MDENRYDVAVIGGGPAGSLCALRLARFGRRVLLADGRFSRPPALAIPEMLAPEGVWLLERLGLSEALDRGGSGPCRGVLSHWDPDGPDFSDLALTQLRRGWIVDRQTFDAGLRAHAAAAGVDVRHSARIRFMGRRGSAPVRLQLESAADEEPGDVTASFVVEATGRRAAPGVAADGAGQRLYFDRLVALLVQVRATLRNDAILRIAPSRSGWWYTFASGEFEAVAVYLTDGDLLPRAPAALACHLEQERSDAPDVIGPISTGETPSPARLLRDARTTCRRSLWRECWLPVGDAAFTLDPLSGSGLTRGLQMADQAASALHEHLTTREVGGLRRMALSWCHEFAFAQVVRQWLYAQCARRFPESRFWRRRCWIPLSRQFSGEGRAGNLCT